jgi:uroporphyrinogen decarboxylase
MYETGEMTPRERVIAALEHRQPDRVPRDLGGTFVTGVNIVAYRNLVRHLGIAEEPGILRERIRHACISETVLERFKIDTRMVLPGIDYDVGRPNLDGTYTDRYGIVRALSGEEGHWYIQDAPLMQVDLTRQAIQKASKAWPDPASPEVIEGVAERARRLHQNTDYAVVLNLPIGCIHQATWLRGFDRWLMDLALDMETSIYFLEVITERFLEMTRRLIEAAGENFDVLAYGDDIAISTGPMMSRRMFDRIVLPYEKKVFNAIRGWTDTKIVFHTDGSVLWHIDELADMGVDALNPVEVGAKGMDDTAALKKRFGERMAFWGAIDTARVLSMGTAQDVQNEVRRRIGDLAQGGGYVLATVHNILAEVLPENICAIWETADAIEQEKIG